jgi:hypothetical protein
VYPPWHFILRIKAAVESAEAGKEKLAETQVVRARSNVELFSSVFIVFPMGEDMVVL